jgi:hypothetical protein
MMHKGIETCLVLYNGVWVVDFIICVKVDYQYYHCINKAHFWGILPCIVLGAIVLPRHKFVVHNVSVHNVSVISETYKYGVWVCYNDTIFIPF